MFQGNVVDHLVLGGLDKLQLLFQRVAVPAHPVAHGHGDALKFFKGKHQLTVPLGGVRHLQSLGGELGAVRKVKGEFRAVAVRHQVHTGAGVANAGGVQIPLVDLKFPLQGVALQSEHILAPFAGFYRTSSMAFAS